MQGGSEKRGSSPCNDTVVSSCATAPSTVAPSATSTSATITTTDDSTIMSPSTLVVQHPGDEQQEVGSSVYGAIFNFTNCIVGAGAIGLGGAFADSGGIISVATIVFFAFLTKLSLDLVVEMSVENSQQQQQSTGTTTIPAEAVDGEGGQQEQERRSASYEELGYIAFGRTGRLAVLLSKFLYSFGCLVAYIIVVKDNFAPALEHFLYGNNSSGSWFFDPNTMTWLLGTLVILPLCLLRDMSPLSNLGAVSIASMGCIVLIVIYIYLEEPDVRRHGGSTYENWFQIRSGYVESWGTFVFTFVSQHTVNLTFESLKPGIRTVKTWKTVSSWSILIASIISLTVGLAVYITFWQDTRSDLFDMYPPMRIVDLAKILLCVTMLLTFPLPFFSCREMLIVSLIRPLFVDDSPTDNDGEEGGLSNDLEEPLLSGSEINNNNRHHNSDVQVAQHGTIDSTSVIFDNSQQRDGICWWLSSMFCPSSSDEFSVMVPGEEKQLAFPLHVALTVVFWGLSTFLAIVSPNLGDILDLVGSATGTAMAFILPGLLSFKLQGYTRLALFILVVGGAIGFMGTLTSLKKLIGDI